MTDQWTEAHQAKALAEGWYIKQVVDMGKPLKSWYYQIFGNNMPNDVAVKYVMAAAKERSEFHIHTLQMCAASRLRGSKI